MGNKVFSERIKKLRINSNMTMDMLAKKLTIPYIDWMINNEKIEY